MIVSLRPGCWVSIPGRVPQRRRVVIVGATEAGVAAAFHLGESALLLEQREVSNADRPALFEAVTDPAGSWVVRRWEPPNLTTVEPLLAGATADDLLRELRNLTGAETRLGACVTAINVRERRLEISTGEGFVYDKLVSTLRTSELLRLIEEPPPTRVQSVESLRYWLNGRDVELLDTATQLSCGDLDGQAAGKRVATGLQRILAAKYMNKALFQPRLVGGLTSDRERLA